MTDLPRSFRRIRLELARTKDHPTGDPQTGYEIVAPLDGDGKLDAAAWKDFKDHCRVRRFRRGDEDLGHLVRHGANWAFHYDLDGDEEDESGYRLGSERFVIGEYMSIHDADDDEMMTYQVVSVEHI